MKASDVFLSTFSIIFLFAVFKWLMGDYDMLALVTGGILGFLVAIIPPVIATGVNIVGSGLNPAAVKILFGICVLLNLLFHLQFTINIANNTLSITLGLGLANILLETFNPHAGILGFFGWVFSAILTFTALVSGLIMIVKGGE